MNTSAITWLMAAACTFLVNPGSSLGAAKPPSPRSRAISAVHHDFPTAETITWLETGKELVASFKVAGHSIRAFYDLKGRLLSTFISGSASHLPFAIEARIAAAYPGFVPQTMTEVIEEKSDDYYVMLRREVKGRVEWMRIKSDRDGHCVAVQRLFQQAG